MIFRYPLAKAHSHQQVFDERQWMDAHAVGGEHGSVPAQKRSPAILALAHACHGLMTATPAASKGLVSRVATVKPLAAAIDAM